MTTPTDAEINAYCAKEIMGWTVRHEEGKLPWYRQSGIYVMDWHPLTDTAQAKMCAEKLCAEDQGEWEDLVDKLHNAWPVPRSVGLIRAALNPRLLTTACYEVRKEQNK